MTQTDILLRTKLYLPPPRPNLIPRPRLTERMQAGRYKKLTLVSAPAGYGKTTLTSDWAAHSNVPIAWLSLDEQDNNLVRFLIYLVAAIQQIDEGIGIDMHTIISGCQLE